MKNPNPLTNPEELTVLVFKDNDSSRTFQIPLGWISRIGLFLGILAGFALLSSFFAVKFYRVARRTQPDHVIELEQELSEVKSANKTLESKLVAGPAAVAMTTAVPVALPVPTVTVTVTPTAVAAASSVSPNEQALFSALPHATQDLTANASKLPIKVSPAKTSWRGKNLHVNFNIQYTATDKGSQQGHIVILARGPETLFAYPGGALNRAGTDSLIAPQKGEYFSVSRFRETHAEFGPVRVPAQIQDVEILLLSMEGALLAYQKITPPAAPAAKAAKPAAPAAGPVKIVPPVPAIAKPASGNSELIEPGVDQ